MERSLWEQHEKCPGSYPEDRPDRETFLRWIETLRLARRYELWPPGVGAAFESTAATMLRDHKLREKLTPEEYEARTRRQPLVAPCPPKLKPLLKRDAEAQNEMVQRLTDVIEDGL